MKIRILLVNYDGKFLIWNYCFKYYIKNKRIGNLVYFNIFYYFIFKNILKIGKFIIFGR